MPPVHGFYDSVGRIQSRGRAFSSAVRGWVDRLAGLAIVSAEVPLGATRKSIKAIGHPQEKHLDQEQQKTQLPLQEPKGWYFASGGGMALESKFLVSTGRAGVRPRFCPSA
jgi:hypothetical protein